MALQQLRDLLRAFEVLETDYSEQKWAELNRAVTGVAWSTLGYNLEKHADDVRERARRVYRVHFAVPTQDGTTSKEGRLLPEDRLYELFQLWIDDGLFEESQCGLRVKETQEELKVTTPIGEVKGTVEIYPLPHATWHLPRVPLDLSVECETKVTFEPPRLQLDLAWDDIPDFICNNYLRKHGRMLLQAMGWTFTGDNICRCLDMTIYDGETELNYDVRLADYVRRGAKLKAKVTTLVQDEGQSEPLLLPLPPAPEAPFPKGYRLLIAGEEKVVDCPDDTALEDLSEKLGLEFAIFREGDTHLSPEMLISDVKGVLDIEPLPTLHFDIPVEPKEYKLPNFRFTFAAKYCLLWECMEEYRHQYGEAILQTMGWAHIDRDYRPPAHPGDCLQLELFDGETIIDGGDTYELLRKAKGPITARLSLKESRKEELVPIPVAPQAPLPVSYRVYFAVPTQDGTTFTNCWKYSKSPLADLYVSLAEWIDERSGFRLRGSEETLDVKTPIGEVKGDIEVYPLPNATWHLPVLPLDLPMGDFPRLQVNVKWNQTIEDVLVDYLRSYADTMLRIMGKTFVRIREDYPLDASDCFDLAMYDEGKELDNFDGLYDLLRKGANLGVKIILREETVINTS